MPLERRLDGAHAGQTSEAQLRPLHGALALRSHRELSSDDHRRSSHASQPDTAGAGAVQRTNSAAEQKHSFCGGRWTVGLGLEIFRREPRVP